MISSTSTTQKVTISSSHPLGRSSGAPHEVRQDGWWSIDADRIERGDLTSVLDASFGVSNELTGLVTAWLVVHKSSCIELQYRFVGDEDVRGTPSFKISSDGQREVTLWFRKSDYALLRFASREVIQPRAEDELPETVRKTLPPEQLEQVLAASKQTLVSERTVDFEPVFDAPVDPALFNFSVPGK
jgi:hypothetical protein